MPRKPSHLLFCGPTIVHHLDLYLNIAFLKLTKLEVHLIYAVTPPLCFTDLYHNTLVDMLNCSVSTLDLILISLDNSPVCHMSKILILMDLTIGKVDACSQFLLLHLEGGKREYWKRDAKSAEWRGFIQYNTRMLIYCW